MIPELHVYHYKARIYSPTLVRFLQSDPIGYDDQVNLYAYVGYNPASQMTMRSTSNDAYVWTGDVNVSRNYAVNGLNQYISAGPASFSYDANGNLTGDGSNAYVYDVENRLVSASGTSSASLRYDPLGRLYETSGGAAGTTRFLYDGDELVAEYSNSGAMLRRYVHGSGSDDPMAWFEGASVDASAAKMIKTNHQGSVIALTDWYGNLTSINSYDEWGIPAPSNTGRFQYTGQAWIPELRMYHYKARIYSPTLGRFLQTDPIGYDDQVNLYAYVGNDPVNMVDPTGMCTGSLVKDTDGGCKTGGFVSGAGSCIGNCTSGRDLAKSFVNGAINQATAASGKPDSCQTKPLCGGQMDSKLARTLLPLLKSSAFKNAVINAWSRSNPYGQTSSKNEHAFWASSKGKTLEVGPVFKGRAASVPYISVISLQNDHNVFLHTHPFFLSEGYLSHFSDNDVRLYKNLNVVGVTMTHNGMYVYDGRD